MEKVTSKDDKIKSQAAKVSVEPGAAKEAAAKTQVNEHAAKEAAAKEAAFKAKKAAAAKAFAERQAALKNDRIEAIKELKALVDANKINLDTMPKTKAWIEKETTVRTSGGSGNNFFNRVFGDSPKGGDKITLIDYMKKTLKAKADLDKYCKQWAEKGTVVEFKDNPANMLESTYTIVKLA